MNRQTVAVDMDGVIHSYTSGWQGADTLPDPPVEGAIEWLTELARHYNVVIFSTRCESEEGRIGVLNYLIKHGFKDNVTITYEKVPAIMYIDDRAYRFEGNNFPSVKQIQDALPWWKR